MTAPALSVLHLSDPHFGTEQPEVVAALHALAEEQRPGIAILSGDVTQRARRSQFAAAGAFFHAIAAGEKLAIPGNHDIPLFNLPARLFGPYAGYTRSISADLQPEVSHPDALVIGVKTTRRYRHKNGELSEAQIARVSHRLARATSSQVRIVVTHQPVHIITASDRQNRLRGYAPAMQAWSAAGADFVLGGHIHLPYVRRINESMPSLPRALWAVQAGTCVSSRTRGGIPNSVNLIRLKLGGAARSCTVERWDYASGVDRFIAVEETVIRLDPVPSHEDCPA